MDSSCPMEIRVSCQLQTLLELRILLSQRANETHVSSFGRARTTTELAELSSSKRTSSSCVVELTMFSSALRSISVGTGLGGGDGVSVDLDEAGERNASTGSTGLSLVFDDGEDVKFIMSVSSLPKPDFCSVLMPFMEALMVPTCVCTLPTSV